MVLSRSSNILGIILKERNIGVRELERLSGVSRTTISNSVNGKREPSVANCEKIAKALNLNVEEIFAVKQPKGFKIKLYNGVFSCKQAEANGLKLTSFNSYTVNKSSLQKLNYNTEKDTKNLIAITLQNSFAPFCFRKGDTLVVDRSLNNVEDGNTYLFCLNGNIYIEKFKNNKNGSLLPCFNSYGGKSITSIKGTIVFGKLLFVEPSSKPIFF